MKRKVLFLIESLGGGGAEKVLDTLVHHLDKDKFDVTVLAICGGGKYEDSVSSSVHYKCVLKRDERSNAINKFLYALKYKLLYNWLPMWVIYKMIIPKGYDVEVAFVEGFATKLLAASSGRESKKIAWVHVDLLQRPWTQDKGVFSSLQEEINAYKKYDKVVCVSKSVEDVMRAHYRLDNTTTIFNPLDAAQIRMMGAEPCSFVVDNSKFNVVSVGRLNKQKGYDLLLPIIERLRRNNNSIHLWLIGEGEEENALREQVESLALSDCVTFTGFLSNPYSLMSKMNLFVCSSRAEGFSLVLAESMILGVPVVSMNCSGPNELIGPNVFGCLCDSYEELENEIRNVMNGEEIPMGIPPIVDMNNALEDISILLG